VIPQREPLECGLYLLWGRIGRDSKEIVKIDRRSRIRVEPKSKLWEAQRHKKGIDVAAEI
jgi:hypothetical protein